MQVPLSWLSIIMFGTSRFEFQAAENIFTLEGYSRAGQATSLVIPQLRLVFDAGTQVQNWNPSAVLISHTHMDHVDSLYRMISVEKPPPVFLGAGALPFVENFLQSYHSMCNMSSEPAQAKNFDLRPVSVNDTFELSYKSNKLLIRVLQCDHRIPCNGYSVFLLVPKLRAEYSSLSGAEKGNLAKQGVKLHTIMQEPLICFLGDTTHNVFQTHPEILEQHRFIVVECTFINTDDKSIQKAKETKHMCWQSLHPIIKDNPRVTFVLTHFSLRHSEKDIYEALSACENVHVMLATESQMG